MRVIAKIQGQPEVRRAPRLSSVDAPQVSNWPSGVHESSSPVSPAAWAGPISQAGGPQLVAVRYSRRPFARARAVGISLGEYDDEAEMVLWGKGASAVGVLRLGSPLVKQMATGEDAMGQRGSPSDRCR